MAEFEDRGSGSIVFVQLQGFKRELRLEGNAAPHGRPRRDPVVAPEVRLRESEVYYPGSNVPTVHVFGSRLEPVTFKGRLRDRRMGRGFAREKNEEIKQFVREQEFVRCTWDDMYDVHGLIIRYTPKIESKHEIEYELELKVTRDLLADEPIDLPPAVKGAPDRTNQILANLKLKDKLPYEPATLKGSIVDVLNAMVSDVNSASAFLLQAADDLNSFATGSFTALRRFRAGLGQLAVVVSNLRGTYDELVITAALENENANHSQPFWDLQAEWAASSLEALRLIAEAEREAAKAEQGRIVALHTATTGETWESIARRWYDGDESRGGDVRTANGAQAGSQPVPGTTYFVPR